MAQLRKLVQPFLLRREKKDVLKELPPKIEHIRRIALGQTERMTYLSAVNAAKSTLTDTGKLLDVLSLKTSDLAFLWKFDYNGENSHRKEAPPCRQNQRQLPRQAGMMRSIS